MKKITLDVAEATLGLYASEVLCGEAALFSWRR